MAESHGCHSKNTKFKRCQANPDVWMHPNVKPDGSHYWDYVLIYVNDALAISNDPKSIMDHLSKRYTLKKGSVKEPTEYLRADIRKHTLVSPD